MLCENCKSNMATVHYSQTINGEHREIYMCSSCAEKMGYVDGGLLGLFSGAPLSSPQKNVCPSCKATPDFYKRTGRLSCPDCYTSFADSLEAMLLKVHGATAHKGDMSPTVSEVDILRRKLQEAVSAEDFEQAAILRDEIRRMEGEGK